MHGERLRRICKRHRTLTRRVEYFKEVHPGGDHSYTRNLGRDEEGHSCPEQRERQEGEREEEEVAAAPSVDCEERGDGEEEVEDAGAHGHEERGVDVEPAVEEDVCAVVGDNVNSAELLSKHDDPAGEGSPSVSWHGEEFDELGEEVFALVCFTF